jgi:gamma-glutamylaminecyclotransferase
MNDKPQLVFVYGTLKKGFYFHDAYLANKADFKGPANTSNAFTLYVDALPHLVREKSHRGVKGELYEVGPELLKELDSLEGHPNFYQRESIEVIDSDGQKRQAWAYLRPKFFQGKQYAQKEEEFT